MYSLCLEVFFPHEKSELAARLCDYVLRTAANQPGFVSGLLLTPEGTENGLQFQTIWNNQAASETFHASAEYRATAASLSDSGLTLRKREAHDIQRWETASAGEVRHIRTSVPAERLDEVAEFWQNRGRQVIESAVGCVRALGFIDREASEFVLVIWWRSASDAEAFRLSSYHEDEFVLPLGEDVIRLTRSHLEPLEPVAADGTGLAHNVAPHV